MITVKMTEAEYKAYLLYRESVEIMKESEKISSEKESITDYFSDLENKKEFEAGLEDINAGRITYIDPENLWESIK